MGKLKLAVGIMAIVVLIFVASVDSLVRLFREMSLLPYGYHSKLFKSKCDKIINIISLCCAIFLSLFLAFVIVSNL